METYHTDINPSRPKGEKGSREGELMKKARYPENVFAILVVGECTIISIIPK